MGLTLAEALRLGRDRPSGVAIAFVGAGGKSTAMFQLARQLPAPVLVTTTTHLGTWQAALVDEHIVVVGAEHVDAGPSKANPEYIFTVVTYLAGAQTSLAEERFVLPPEEYPGKMKLTGVTLVTGPSVVDDRLSEPPAASLRWLHDIARRDRLPLLIEADGAHQKPLKAPAEHEPAMPPGLDIVVVVAGLQGLGKPLSSAYVHRVNEFASVSSVNLGQPITPDGLVRVLKHPQAGGLKHVSEGIGRVVLLNQADTDELRAQARGMAVPLLQSYDAVIVASLGHSEVHAVHEHVAGIVLAAGSSQRLGRPKQLLDWRGQPFVRAVAETALKAGLSPVVVVIGSNAGEVEAAVHGLPVQIAQNDAWQTGQASSIRAGVQALPPRAGGVVFLLADQPQVKFEVITALVNTHATGLHAIVAPLVMMEQRANPVLFDRATFHDLLGLEGDVGGRAVFSKHRVEYMPWHDDRLLLDVDTEEDYRRLVEDDTL